VAGVQRNSPAAEAGFHQRVVITQIGGESVESMDRLAEQLADVNAGDMVSMSVVVTTSRVNMILEQTANVSLKAR
jgi:S1-C subfamily serine protease